jgi:hypothetical protein
MPAFKEIGKDGKYTVRPHHGQQRVLDSKARFTVMLAGTQSGKTCLGPIWLHREILRGIESEDKKELPNDYIAGTANYDLFKLKMLPELLDYFENVFKVGRYWAGDRVIELADNLQPGNFWAKNATDPMWGRIILRSAEASGGWESGTIKGAWLDEAAHPDFNRTAWEGTQRRLSLSRGRALFTTTLYDWDWFKLDIYDRWEAGDPDYDVIQFDSIENPAFPKEEYERAKRTLPGWKFDLFYRGRYSRPAGLIYDCFDEKTCKIARFEIPKDWPRYFGADFGPVHTGGVWYAQDPATGYLYLYRSYVTNEKISAPAHAAKWIEMSKGEPIRKRVGGSHQEEGWRDAYALSGWPIAEPLVRDVEVGIDRVYAWHKTNRLFVFDDLHDYLAEKVSYSRELDDNYAPTDKIKNKERYHLCDAERYILSDFQPVDAYSRASSVIKVQRFGEIFGKDKVKGKQPIMVQRF